MNKNLRLIKNNPTWIFLFVLLMVFNASVAWAQCGVTMSCTGSSTNTTTTPPKLCVESMCFKDEASKKQFERINNCAVENKCDYAVKRVKEEFKKILKTDPTYGFYRNQNCIANKSCNNKVQLEKTEWLDKVVYDFIMPLVEEKGNWKAKKQECKDIVVGADLRCQQIMANYHIQIDLQNSVNKNGCGTEKDWNLIGEWLKQCIEKGVQDDLIRGFQTFGTWTASYLVASERAKIRNQCINFRKSP